MLNKNKGKNKTESIRFKLSQPFVKANSKKKSTKPKTKFKDRFKEKFDSLNTKFENWTAKFDKPKSTKPKDGFNGILDGDGLIITPTKPMEKKQPFYQQLNADLNKNINSNLTKRPGVVKKQEESFKVSEKKTNLPFSQTVKITATATNRTRYKKDTKKVK